MDRAISTAAESLNNLENMLPLLSQHILTSTLCILRKGTRNEDSLLLVTEKKGAIKLNFAPLFCEKSNTQCGLVSAARLFTPYPLSRSPPPSPVLRSIH